MRYWTISILVVLLGSSYIHSQQASDKVSYEGQTVAAVDLVASPRISVDSLRPLLQQRTGEAYSDSKVESTISALRATGRFTAVKVDVKPDPGGLHVTFTLEPALYFGVFDFPGASKGFSYTRLLQVIDIPTQTPYKQDVVAKAGDNLRNFFVAAGYFQAQVQPEPQFDEIHMLADVIFHINLGKRAKVGNVEVKGAEPAETNRLLHATRSLRATLVLEIRRCFCIEVPLSGGALLTGESKLHDLGVFDWANVEPRRAIADQDNEDVLVKV